MRFGALGVSQVSSQVLGAGVSISLALLGFHYWALVGGSIAMSASSTLISFYMCPWVPGRPRRGTGVRSMLGFGRNIMGFEFVNYLSRSMDNILIGRFIGADQLGLYAKAYSLFMLPITQIRGPVISVAMPVLSALKEHPQRYRRYYGRLVDILATLTVPIALYTAVEADFLVRVVLGANWAGVVPVFRVLAIAGVVQAVVSTRGLVLLSHGESRRYLIWGAINAGVMVVAFVCGLPSRPR
jgi:O-antigen/teichoic acid export membrane protein